MRRSDTAEQSDETGVYRVHCYFSTAPERNFELFYCELDAESANASIAHSPRAQEYIYVIEGSLTLKTDTAVYELHAGDSLVFSSSVNHTYINDGKIKVKFMVINYYPY